MYYPTWNLTVADITKEKKYTFDRYITTTSIKHDMDVYLVTNI
jgi:hypothetical protein